MSTKINTAIGKLVDEIQQLQKKRDAIAAKVVALNGVIYKKKELLIAKFSKSKLNGARGRVGVAALIAEDVPVIEDFNALCKFVKQEDAFDLFQKRLSKQAWLERVRDNVKMPGITTFHRVDVRVSASKKGDKK